MRYPILILLLAMIVVGQGVMHEANGGGGAEPTPPTPEPLEHQEYGIIFHYDEPNKQWVTGTPGDTHAYSENSQTPGTYYTEYPSGSTTRRIEFNPTTGMYVEYSNNKITGIEKYASNQAGFKRLGGWTPDEPGFAEQYKTFYGRDYATAPAPEEPTVEPPAEFKIELAFDPGTSTTTTTTSEEEKQEKIMYVNEGNTPVTILGNTIPPGGIFPLTEEQRATIPDFPSAIVPVNPRVLEYLQANKDKFIGFRNGQYEFRPDVRTTGETETYRTETRTTWKPDGTRTDSKFVAVCGKGALSVCDKEKPEYVFVGMTSQTRVLDTKGNTQFLTEAIWADPAAAPIWEQQNIKLDGTFDKEKGWQPKLEDGNPVSAGKPVEPAVRLVQERFTEEGKLQGLPKHIQLVTGTYVPKIVNGQVLYDATFIANMQANDPAVLQVTYYDVTVDANGKATVTKNNLGALPLPDRQKDGIRKAIVATGILTWDDAFNTRTTMQNLGILVRGYEEYRGIAQLTSLIWPEWGEQVQERRRKIEQDFLFATGIQRTIEQPLCGAIADFKPESEGIILGRGPGGEPMSSGRINGYTTPPISLAGLTREQFVTLFGNVTYINGVRYDVNDPAFMQKLAQLGRFSIRLYQFSYSLTNNLEQYVKDIADWEPNPVLNYNVEFRGQRNVKFFAKDKQLNHTMTDKGHREKYSTTQYTHVCLTFNPPLPAFERGVELGNAFGVALEKNEICVPFVDQSGAPTTIGDAPPEQTPDEEAGIDGELV